MTMHEINTMINEYNDKRATLTVKDAGKLLSNIEKACKELSGENHKATLENLVTMDRTAILSRVIDCDSDIFYTAVSVKRNAKTDALEISEREKEVTYLSIAAAHEEKHETTLSAVSTFKAEFDGFCQNLLKCAGTLCSEKEKAALIISKEKGKEKIERVDVSETAMKDAVSKTKLLKNLQTVCDSLLPDEIKIKVVKRDLNWMLNAVSSAKGRGQTSAKIETMYKQLFHMIYTNRTGKPYGIYSKF